jgi:hypothetical protein
MSAGTDPNITAQANDGSLHVFPAGTKPEVVANTLARYQASRATNQDNPNKQTPMSSSMNPGMTGGSNMSAASAPGGGEPWRIPGWESNAGRVFPPIPLPKPGTTPDFTPTPVVVPPAIRPSIGAVPGYPESGRSAWRGANDVAFQDAAYNYDVQNSRAPNDPGYVSPELMKAWAMQEPGGAPKAFRTDPFTANNPGDWNNAKATAAGLVKGQKMTPQASADAALKWLQHTLLLKGHVFYPGDYEALREYNARTDAQPDGNMFSQDYANNILNNYHRMMGNGP